MPRFECAADGPQAQGIAAEQAGKFGEIGAAAMPLNRQKCGSRLDP
jgi:hypothetical protein